MRNQNFFQVVVILSAVVGITSIDPKSQLSALIAVKKAAAQSACKNTQGDNPSDHNIEMKERPLIGIASYLAALGQYDQALKLVDRMKACDLRDIALVKVASTLAKGGEYDQALKLVDRMKEPGFRDIALVEVASTLAKERQFDRALQLVNIIRR